jgi:hypothetical protein
MAFRPLQKHPGETKKGIGDVALLNLLDYLCESPFFRQKIDLNRCSFDLRANCLLFPTLKSRTLPSLRE